MIPAELAPVFTFFLIPVLGLCAGSFILEVADRLPEGEDFIRGRSKCAFCGHPLGVLDLVPVLSFLFLGGKCRYCKKKLSFLYPAMEFLNALLWCLVFYYYGLTYLACIFALFSTALLGLSLIDARTGIIPFGFPVFIGILGLVRLGLEHFVLFHGDFWIEALIGFFAVSVPLLLIYYLSKGKAIGGGDIKLMAAAGLLLGYKLILLGFVLACVLGSVIHLIRMRFFGADRVLRMGPYLAAGCFLSLIWGGAILNWYFSLY